MIRIKSVHMNVYHMPRVSIIKLTVDKVFLML